MKLQKLVIICALIAFATLVYAGTFTVPGTSNPWLAGMTNGSTAGCGVDTAPAESPVLVTGVTLNDGWVLTFSASGAVGYEGGVSDPPDGDTSYFLPRTCGSENGIANINAPADALLGVFLDDTQPSLSTAPQPYSNAITAVTFTPGLRQPFFIGDGLTGLGSGTQQQFVVPTGATRLFLGTMDGFEWNNNVGSFLVTVMSAPQLIIVQTIGSQVQLSWPTNATGYTLQSATNLATSAWAGMTNSPDIVADKFVLTIVPTNGEQYFRLSYP